MLLIIRRAALLLALVMLIVCSVLLLNVTAPNPTGRRYSSAVVPTTGGGQFIGTTAEMILARDLGAPRNEDGTQRRCLCAGTTPPSDSRCLSCEITNVPLLSTGNYRIPDFITPDFIAESKSRRDWLYEYTDQAEQITDYAAAALMSGRPLWVYVRVDTRLSPEFIALAEATGGGVVRYFAVEGWIDPVDRTARLGGAVAVVVIALTIIAGVLGKPRGAVPPPPALRAARMPADPLDFAARAKARVQTRIDDADARFDHLPPL